MPKTAWKAFLYAIQNKRAAFAALFLLMLVGYVLGFIQPYFYKLIADYAVSHSTNFQWSEVLFPALAIIGSLVGTEACFRIAHYMEIPVTLRSYGQITSHLFRNLLARPSSYFEDRFSGELTRRIEQIGEGTKFFLSEFTWTVGWILTALTSALGLLYITHTLLFGYFCLWLLFFAVTSYPLLRWQYSYAQNLSESQADLSGQMVDALSNISIVHTFAAEKTEQRHFMDVLTGMLHTERKEKLMFFINRSQQGLNIVVLGIVLLVGSLQLFARGEMTVGDFLLVASLSPSLAGVIWSTGDAILQTLRNYGKMSDAVRDLQTDVERVPEGTKPLNAHENLVDMQNVSFTYPGTAEAVFTDFSLHIKAGERVGFVGHSGAGKSTLVKLLLRQYDPSGGVVRIGAEDIRTVTLESLRQAIAFVPQDTSLFHRSLYENIAYAKADATREEVLVASAKAHAHDFIEATPQKYDTLVGERGIKLSGGQRQRIAIARAMLKNAPILILDEATSALDSESEEIVQKGLRELFEGRTVIAIAHRLSTLREMDRIVVIENGKVVENGSPKELLAKERGVFKDLWEHQKGGFVG